MFNKRLVTVVLGMALAGAFGAAQAGQIGAVASKDTPTELNITWTGNLLNDSFDGFNGLDNWTVEAPNVSFPVANLFVVTVEAYHATRPHLLVPETTTGPTFSGGVAGFLGWYAVTSAMADHNALPTVTWTSPANWTNPHWDHYSFSVTSAANGNATIELKALHPVPEPETYAMLLAGLGVIGAVIRRRSRR